MANNDNEHKTSDQSKTHKGSCHCGVVRFQVDLDLSDGASQCNCTICTKIMTTGCIVKPTAFTLLAGEDSLSEYVWGGKISQRYFCKHCGIHCFGRGVLEMLGGAFVSININALDDIDPAAVPLKYWDGRHNNWQSGTSAKPWPIFDAPTLV